MKIILKQDVPNLGKQDQMVTVKNGYAQNYLVPKGLAIIASESAQKVHAETLKQRAHKENRIMGDASEIAKKLKNIEIIIGAKTSSTGKIFGSVNTIQLAEAINKKGFEIDRKIISLNEEHIKEVGKYTAKIKLHRDVIVELPFEVVSE